MPHITTRTVYLARPSALMSHASVPGPGPLADAFSVPRIGGPALPPPGPLTIHALKLRKITHSLLDSRRTLHEEANVHHTDMRSGSQPPSRPLLIDMDASPRCRRRAAAIAMLLSLKYAAIEHIQSSHGPYNPLKVIRDRDKGCPAFPSPHFVFPHSHATISSIPEVPLASNVFSTHARKHRNYRFIWAVPVLELVAHIEWSQHSRPREPSATLAVPLSSPHTPPARSHASNSPHSLMSEDEATGMRNPAEKLGECVFTHVARIDSDDEETLFTKPAPAGVPPVITELPASSRLLPRGRSSQGKDAFNDEHWARIAADLEYCEKQIDTRLYNVHAVFPRRNQHLAHRMEEAHESLLQNAIEKTVAVSDYCLPEFRQLHTAFLQEIKSVMHLINNDYSVRVDHLLASSDRLVGEINTSLSMELFRVTERVDRLYSVFNGAVPIVKATHADGGQNQILYFALETTIVVLLRLVWAVVNVYKALLCVAKFLLSIFT